MKIEYGMKTEAPLVSVAMPVYNAENYIRSAIESILQQTYSNFELILVNDASTDRSNEIILSYKDERIRYEENSSNMGIAKTRNKCVQLARGKYIAVLDNDDIAKPDRLELQVEFLESQKDFGVCGSFYEIINEKGRVVTKMKVPVTDCQVKTYLLFDNCFCNSTIMIESKLLKERKYEEEFDMIEDYYFLYEISKSKRLYNLPAYTTQYRVHGKNTSIQKLAAMRNLRSKMDRIVLEDHGIPFTAEEFDLHTNFVNGNLEHFQTLEQICKLEKWLIKLILLLEDRKTYDMDLIKRIFIRRWILLFRRTRSASHKIVFNDLFKKFRLKYVNIFFRLVIERFTLIRSKA
jgi:glycosyltransferase involved in cell wall biosynthesis